MVSPEPPARSGPAFQSRFKQKDLFLVFAWSLVCFLAFSYKLHSVPPYDIDEYYYVRSVKFMVETGDYITPRFHDIVAWEDVRTKRFEKPILTYWAIALSYKLFGVDLVFARLPSALAGALCIPLVFLLARSLFGRRPAFFSTLIFPGLLLQFEKSRLARPDMIMTLLILTALYFFVRGMQEEDKRKSHFLLFYLCLGLGFLTKGPVALLLPLMPIALFFAWPANRLPLRQMRLGSGTLIFLAVNLPWFLAMIGINGQEYIDHVLQVEIKGRVQHADGYKWFYLYTPFTYNMPWSFFFLAALASFLGFARTEPEAGAPSRFSETISRIKARCRTLSEPCNRWVLFCLIWFGAPLLFFTVFQNYRARYILTVCAPLALLSGYFLNRLLADSDKLKSWLFKVPFFLSLAYYFGLAVYLGFIYQFFSRILDAPVWVTVFPVLLVLGMARLAYLYYTKKGVPLIVTLAVFQVLVLALIHGDILPYYNNYPLKKLAAAIEREGTGAEEVYILNLGNDGPKLGVQTMQWVRVFGDPEIIRKFIPADKKIFVVLTEADWKKHFHDAPLTEVARDLRLKKIKVNGKLIQTVREKGIVPTFRKFLEVRILFSNKPQTPSANALPQSQGEGA